MARKEEPSTSMPISASPLETSDTSDDNAEGRRMQLIRRALEKVFDKCYSSITCSDLKKCYPQLEVKQIGELKRHYLDSLNQAIVAEVDVLFEEEQVVKLVNGLDDLDRAAASRKQAAWRPTGCAETDLQAHLAPVWQQERDRLQKMLQQWERKNVSLQRQVQSQQRHLQEDVAASQAGCDELVQAAQEADITDILPNLSKWIPPSDVTP